MDQLVVRGQDMLEVVSTQVLSSPNIRQVNLQSKKRSSSIEPAIDDQDCSCYLAGKMKLTFGKLFRPAAESVAFITSENDHVHTHT